MSLPFWFGAFSDADFSPPGDFGSRRRRSRARDTLEPTGDADRITVERIRAGDVAEFERMVREHVAALQRFAYDYLHSTDAAEEVVDDVWMWVWNHRTDWQVRGSLRAYLFGAVRNRALNAIRDAKYRDQWSVQNAGDSVAAGLGAAPERADTAIEHRELGAMLRAAIDRLPETRRTVVVLRWMHEMSYAEVAQVTGTSVVGVKQRLNRALRELRALLPDVLR